MGLKVWLPLNGTLENKGYSGITVTNNNATIDANGKIGSCYYFNGSAQYLQLSETVGNLYSNDFSWAVWLKPTDSTRSIISSEYSSSGSANVAFELTASRAVRIYWNGSPDIYPTNTTLPINTWTHVAITKSTGIIKTYINGELKHTYTGTLSDRTSTSKIRIGDDYRGGTSVSYMGYMNDWRLYDHCLSAAEVREISQGLVLHYKLDGTDIPNENLGNTSADYNNKTEGQVVAASAWGGDAGSITFHHSGGYAGLPYKEYHKTATGSGGIYVKTANDINLEANTTYTMSCWIKGSRAFNASQHTFNINRGSDNLYITYGTTIPITTDWQFFSKTFTTTDTQNGAYGEMSIVYDDGATDYYVYYSGFKIEKGSIATRWTPPGVQYTTIQDSSGYNHNGTITGNIQITSNSSRYSNCIYIPSGNTDYITTSDEIGNFSSGITMNIWFKSSCTTPGSNYHEIFNIATATQNFEMAIYKTGYFRGGMVINGTRYVDNTNNTNIVDGNWHMITMTYDGTTLRRYVDAIDKKDTTISGTLTSTSCKFLLGHYGTNTSYYAKEAYLSDARIYCTALSAADIKQLYELGAKVDNLGNIHIFELQENKSVTKITKTGQLQTLTVYENGYKEILQYDKNILVEPDGSTWVHIFHHSDPATAKFTNGGGDWSAGIYLDANRWYDVEKIINNLPSYEFLHIQKDTSSSTAVKRRWIQSANPLTAAWDDVKPGTPTFITTSGYTSSSQGGMYLIKNGILHMCIANGSNGNWYGGIGACAAYQNGIPGYPNSAVTSGSIDLYARVYINAKHIKNIGTSAYEFIEL